MGDVSRFAPVALAVTGLVLFVIATVAGSNVLYGIADLLVGVALALFAVAPQPPDAPSVAAIRGGLALAAAAAIVDGLLTLGDRVGTATDILTIVIVAGVAIALAGRGLRR